MRQVSSAGELEEAHHACLDLAGRLLLGPDLLKLQIEGLARLVDLLEHEDSLVADEFLWEGSGRGLSLADEHWGRHVLHDALDQVKLLGGHSSTSNRFLTVDKGLEGGKALDQEVAVEARGSPAFLEVC